jgi:YVTN family beta-propeller protein
VSVIDAGSNTVLTTIPQVGDQPDDVVFHPTDHVAYVTNELSGNVAVIDTDAHRRTVDVAVGGRPLGIALTREGALAYVTSAESDAVVVIDTEGNQVTGRISVGRAPADVAIGKTVP